MSDRSYVAAIVGYDQLMICNACQHGQAVSPRLTWCIISFKISTGRSSNRRGPLVAFSFPFGVWRTASGVGDAPAALGTVR